MSMLIDMFISRNKKANGKRLSSRFPKVSKFVAKARRRKP